MSTNREEQAETKRQHDAAKRTLALEQEDRDRNQGAHISSKATVASHVGKAPHEKNKPDHIEHRKVNKAGTTGDPHHEVVEQRTGGEVTDLVTKSPKAAQPGGGTGAPLNEPQRASRVVGAPGDGSGKGGEKEPKAARKRSRKRR